MFHPARLPQCRRRGLRPRVRVSRPASTRTGLVVVLSELDARGRASPRLASPLGAAAARVYLSDKQINPMQYLPSTRGVTDWHGRMVLIWRSALAPCCACVRATSFLGIPRQGPNDIMRNLTAERRRLKARQASRARSVLGPGGADEVVVPLFAGWYLLPPAVGWASPRPRRG